MSQLIAHANTVQVVAAARPISEDVRLGQDDSNDAMRLF